MDIDVFLNNGTRQWPELQRISMRASVRRLMEMASVMRIQKWWVPHLFSPIFHLRGGVLLGTISFPCIAKFGGLKEMVREWFFLAA